jgi:transposase
MPPVNRNQPKRANSSESQYSLMEFMAEFPDDAACLEWLWRSRYSVDGEKAYCPKCESERAFRRYETSQQRQSWTCTGCGHHLHPTAGTIFHKSSTSLHLWFYAMYLMTSTRCGISAKQMERELGVTYKTAWRMAHLIRTKLMSQDVEPFKGGQPVEMDETYVGGRRRARFDEEPVKGRP